MAIFNTSDIDALFNKYRKKRFNIPGELFELFNHLIIYLFELICFISVMIYFNRFIRDIGVVLANIPAIVVQW